MYKAPAHGTRQKQKRHKSVKATSPENTVAAALCSHYAVVAAAVAHNLSLAEPCNAHVCSVASKASSFLSWGSTYISCADMVGGGLTQTCTVQQHKALTI